MKRRLQWLVLTVFVSACGSTESGNPEVNPPDPPLYPPPGTSPIATGAVAPSAAPSEDTSAPSINEASRQPCELVVSLSPDAGLMDAALVVDAALMDAAPLLDAASLDKRKPGPLLYRCSVLGGEIVCECGVVPETATIPRAPFPSADECRSALFSQCAKAIVDGRDAGPGKMGTNVSP